MMQLLVSFKFYFGPKSSSLLFCSNIFQLVECLGKLFCAVYDIEYAFGAHDFPTSGVFEVEPRQCPGFRFRKSICIGTTHLNPHQVRDFIEHQAANYCGDTYHLVVKNCNHFCEDICYKLTGKRIPSWVNRLARIGILTIYYTIN